jgi:hypothetical protein
VPAVPPAARRNVDRPLARDVERLLRAALTGPAEPGVDVGLDILDDSGADPDDRAARRSSALDPCLGRDGGGRAGGRHRASSVGGYLRTSLVADAAVGATAAAAGSALRPDGEVALPVLLLPPALVVSLGLSGAYERRILLAGLAQYRRVVRAGVGLLAAGVVASVLAPVTLPPSYILAVLPAATAGTVAGRFLLRRRRRSRAASLSRAVAGERPMRR